MKRPAKSAVVFPTGCNVQATSEEAFHLKEQCAIKAQALFGAETAPRHIKFNNVPHDLRYNIMEMHRQRAVFKCICRLKLKYDWPIKLF